MSSMSVQQCLKQEMMLQKSTFGSTAEMRLVFLTQMWIGGETLCLNTTHSCRSGRKHGRAVMDRVFSEPGHYRSSWHHFLTPGTDAWTRALTNTHTHTHSHHTAGVWCFRPMMQTHTHSGSVFLLRGSEIPSANVRDSRPFKTVVEDVRSETAADSETGL